MQAQIVPTLQGKHVSVAYRVLFLRRRGRCPTGALARFSEDRPRAARVWRGPTPSLSAPPRPQGDMQPLKPAAAALPRWSVSCLACAARRRHLLSLPFMELGRAEFLAR